MRTNVIMEVEIMLEKDAMDILLKFLDNKAREAEEEVTQKGVLSDNKAIPLILKTQFNHIAHLETAVDQKFDQVDKRFEQVDKRFEQVDKRFEQVDKRFEQVDRRFEQVDRRFEQIRAEFRTEIGEVKTEMNRRFERMERHLLGGFAALGFLMTVFRFLR